ncbi:MAG: GYD domain-containing protein [candidate division Zixibacteria bacterium]|nr:GYD domain-containing protein [candidate division Zixibacteria bacterium]MDH3938571.1 GYD domain-containing protein [candidate division Zixibacteria bacterium]MDH4034037.1 GYD domain-containing protein [candidate division Zixibacteria bacterium]
MSTYILMTKLSPEAAQRMDEREAMGQSWLKQVTEKCPEVKFIAHYGLLGTYDFMAIYEAPNEEVAAKVSMISMANGAFVAESWQAIPYRRLVELSKEI